MGKYLKRFILASLIYLGLAAIFGILTGMTDIGYFGNFAHTHFNLLGFMSMMVFGIGYFIIPRFNGRNLKFESWVPPHFWLGNFSLIGMVVFRGLYIQTGSDLSNVLFIISATIQVITIFMFIINIWLTLTPEKQKTAATVPAADSRPMPKASNKTKFVVSDETKIASLVDLVPSMKQYLIDSGLGALSLPGHLDKVRQMGITIGTAAANHGLDLDRLIIGIEQRLQESGYDTRVTADGYPESSANDEVEITPEIMIGEIIKNYPEARPVFESHFGNGCFDCPGQSFESVDMACRIHGIEPLFFIKELNAAIGR